jgi:uncharacterized protein YggE
MRTTALALALFLFLGACAGPAAAQVPDRMAPPQLTAARPPPRTLRVSGEARVSVKPDVARVTAGVLVTGKDIQKAVADAQARMKAVLDELARLGIEAKDVRTSQYQLSADRPWVEGRQLPIQGYTVTNSARVTVRSLDKLPLLLSRLTAVGGNAIDALEFEKEELGPARNEALALAVGAARARAEVVAKAAGVALGEVLTVDAQPGRPIQPFAANVMGRMEMAKAGGEAPVAAGEIEVDGTVEIVFAIR